MDKFERLISNRAKAVTSSAIRDLLNIDVKVRISFGGGYPSPESFPTKDIIKIVNSLQDKSAEVFQYGRTEGYTPLLEALLPILQERKISLSSPDEIFIGTGSQGILDGIGRVLINEGDAIAVESPTYIGAIQAFSLFQPKFISLPYDDNGIIPDELEKVLQKNHLKFIYSVPTFQNPTGRTIPIERRKKIAGLLEKYNVLLVEDDPYYQLIYTGETSLPIKTLAPEHVVYINTLSKVLAPAFRIGYAVAPKSIREALIKVKQGTDVATSTINQAIAAEYIKGEYYQKHIPSIIKLYAPRLQTMLSAIEKYFPVECSYTKPRGGMFVWVDLGENADIKALYNASLKAGVTFVKGTAFYTDKRQGTGTMRLNFTSTPEEKIVEGIAILGNIIKHFQKDH